MPFTLNITQNLNSISNSWDKFLPTSHHLKSANLKALENCNLPDIEYFYVEVLSSKSLIGVAYYQLFAFQKKHLALSNNNKLKRIITTIVLSNKKYVLVCGNLFRVDYQGFYFAKKENNHLIAEVTNKFVHQTKKKKPCGIIIKDCEEELDETAIQENKFSFFTGDVTMELKRRKDWNNFDDYLNSLSKKYKKRAIKIIESFSNVQQQLLTQDEILLYKTEIENLYNEVVNKQTVKMGLININYFFELKKLLKNNFEMYLLKVENKIIGFYTYIFYENSMETHYIGIDYSYNNIYKTYFNILFLSVQKLIEKKYDKLELGRTAKEAKANLGSDPKQIINYIKVRNVFAKLVMTYYQQKFNQQENDKQLHRNPFKQHD